MNNIGVIYRDQGDIQRALDYLHKSLKIWKEIGYKAGQALALKNIGGIYLDLGNVDEAREYAQKSYGLAKELGFPKEIRNAAELFSKVHRKQGDFKQAFEMYVLFIQMRDTVATSAAAIECSMA